MTNFEASRILEMSLDVRCSNECYVKKYDECDDCAISEAFCLAIETLEKADIYGWHDLRKDPNDLPTNSIESVLTEHKLLGLRCYAVCQYTENGFEDGINPAELLNKNVIAWREIEPFEVEE